MPCKWMVHPGGFLRNDGFGAKYVCDLYKDIIKLEGFGQPIQVNVTTIAQHGL